MGKGGGGGGSKQRVAPELEPEPEYNSAARAAIPEGALGKSISFSDVQKPKLSSKGTRKAQKERLEDAKKQQDAQILHDFGYNPLNQATHAMLAYSADDVRRKLKGQLVNVKEGHDLVPLRFKDEVPADSNDLQKVFTSDSQLKGILSPRTRRTRSNSDGHHVELVGYDSNRSSLRANPLYEVGESSSAREKALALEAEINAEKARNAELEKIKKVGEEAKKQLGYFFTSPGVSPPPEVLPHPPARFLSFDSKYESIGDLMSSIPRRRFN